MPRLLRFSVEHGREPVFVNPEFVTAVYRQFCMTAIEMSTKTMIRTTADINEVAKAITDENYIQEPSADLAAAEGEET